MIGILTKNEIDTNFKHVLLDSVKDLTDDIKVLIADMESLDKKDVSKYSDALVVIITKKYTHEEAKYTYQNYYNYYLQVNNKSDIDEFLNMLANKEIKSGSIVTIDELTKTVVVKGNEIKLTSKEFLIFNYLHENQGELCLRKKMLNDIFGYHAEAETRIIDVYIKYLRTKLGSEGKKIETIRGKGYIYHL
ncbi:MAG: winged helix-turn-helix domain-containing protein [Mycoplasmatales bacterium]